ncbi:hypothetical protein D0S45_20290 [Marinifilum sp. JC120]|nr:hypothetical protein D0S45_20290 [Marinifilum sp. JC120]
MGIASNKSAKTIQNLIDNSSTKAERNREALAQQGYLAGGIGGCRVCCKKSRDELGIKSIDLQNVNEDGTKVDGNIIARSFKFSKIDSYSVG